jgi:hypothetical protein
MATIELRKTSSGKEKWRACIRIKGFKNLSATFDSKKEAEEWAGLQEKTLRSLKKGDTHLFTLNQAFDRYVEEEQKSKSTRQISDEIPHIEFWRKNLGKKILRNITSSEIELIADALYEVCSKRTKKSLSKETIRKYLCTLSFVFSTAALKWKWIGHNPVLYVNKHKEKERKPKFIDCASRNRFFAEWKIKIDSIMGKEGINSVSSLARKIGIAKTSAQSFYSANTSIKKALEFFEKLDYTMQIEFIPKSLRPIPEQ